MNLTHTCARGRRYEGARRRQVAVQVFHSSLSELNHSEVLLSFPSIYAFRGRGSKQYKKRGWESGSFPCFFNFSPTSHPTEYIQAVSKHNTKNKQILSFSHSLVSIYIAVHCLRAESPKMSTQVASLTQPDHLMTIQLISNGYSEDGLTKGILEEQPIWDSTGVSIGYPICGCSNFA